MRCRNYSSPYCPVVLFSTSFLFLTLPGSDSSAVTVSNSAGSSAAVAKAAAASGSRYGQIVRGLVIVHAAGLAVYMLRWLRPKAYVFPLPLEAFFAVGAIGLLHLFSGKL